MINEGGVTVSALNSEVATSPRGPTVAQGNPSFPSPSYQCTHVKRAAPADSSRRARLPTPWVTPRDSAAPLDAAKIELWSGSGPGDCYASSFQRSTISTFHICLPALLGSHFRGVVGHTRRKVGPYLWKRSSDYLPMSSGGAIPGSPYPLGE